MEESFTAMTAERTNPRPDELEMVKTARADPKAFGKLYLLYVEKVFRYLFGRLGNVHEAEDITAQTFLAAFESFDKFRQDGHFAPWLFTIARNKANDHFRKRYNKIFTDPNENISIETDPLEGVIHSDQAAFLSKLIRTLPEEDRELLRLRYLADMSFPEIARLLHRKEDAVKKSIHRLLARLKSQAEVSNE